MYVSFDLRDSTPKDILMQSISHLQNFKHSLWIFCDEFVMLKKISQNVAQGNPSSYDMDISFHKLPTPILVSPVSHVVLHITCAAV